MRIAFELNRIVVEFDDAVSELSLAKTSTRSYHIDNPAIDLKNRVNIVKIAIAPAPEIEMVYSRARDQSLRFAGSDSLRTALDRLDCPSIRIGDRYLEVASFRVGALVLHLRFGSDRCAPAGDIKVACMNVHAGGAKARIERQRLVQLVSHVQVDVLVDAAVVSVKIPIVPLKRRIRRLFVIGP